MDINKHLVDQWLKGIIDRNPEWFADINDENRKVSRAFVLLSVSTYLNIELTEARSLMTDGGGDAGIDAIYVGDITADFKLPVTIFQGKYKRNLETESHFPANEIQKIISTVRTLFDLNKDISTLNPLLKSEIEEIRSIMNDGCTPRVRVVLCNNGLPWNQEGRQHLINADLPEDQTEFEHINHEKIVRLVNSPKGIDTTIQLHGASFVDDDFSFKRVLVGKISVGEIARLFDKYGDSLLEKNIRRYLGLNSNKVNKAIRDTLLGNKEDNFYFKNNGITMICRKFSHNALQRENWNVRAEDIQIINGGQTCKTIQHTIANHPDKDYSQVFVLVRLYELSISEQDNEDFINEITLATNSQSPVDLRDLRSNDRIQKTLEADVKELGYEYRRKRGMTKPHDLIVPFPVAARAIFSIWKKQPHLAKSKKEELFGNLYDRVFTPDLNAAQVVVAVLIYRYCDNQRRKISLIEEFPHIPYSNYFMSMITGGLLLRRLQIPLEQLTHKNFGQAKEYFETHKEPLFDEANRILIDALNRLYHEDYKKLDMERLSAVFRRSDLYNQLKCSLTTN
jgi:hypothetical protein